MMKMAIYVRVSTEEQAKKGVSLAAQEESLKSYCKTYGYEIYRIYRDKGKSAKDIKGRPAMQQLLTDAKDKKFNGILIYKLDRFSRSLKDLILTIEQLKKWGVEFISLQDKIETTSASGKLMFHIISAFAEFERDIIGERTKFGMKKKATDGSITNRAPLGYMIKNKRLVVNPKEKAQVNDIFTYFLNNRVSLNRLAKRYGYTVRGIKKLLKNKTYVGMVKFDKEWNKGVHEPILPQELFDKVQEKLGELVKVNKAEKR
jgi:site-specific DNA recombinase